MVGSHSSSIFYNDAYTVNSFFLNQKQNTYFQQRIPVFQKVYHEDFVKVDADAGKTTDNDICLLFLSRPIEWNQAVAPACLPEPNDEPVEGERCFTAGWGLTFWGQGNMHPNLMETYADIIPSGEVRKQKYKIFQCAKF